MGMKGMIGTLRSFSQAESVFKQKVKPGTARRRLEFATPYSGPLAIVLIVVILDAAIGTVYPLIYREIINQGVLKSDASLIIRFALLAGVLGLFRLWYRARTSHPAFRTPSRCPSTFLPAARQEL
jgi:ATP-binding cassette subfamily B protein